jgi:FkbM family methyltransferase
LRERFSDTDHAQIVEVAASDRSGQATFFEEADAGTTSSLVAGAAHLGARQREVSVRRLDVLLAEHGLESVDYLKIDAEGHDLHVLRGAGQWLSEQRVKFLQFEYNEPWLAAGSTLREALSLLDHYEYAVYLLKGQGLHRFPYDVYGDFFHYANFVAFPKERERELARLIRGTI